MRVAVVHDWLNGMRGGEKVLEALLEVFPGATIHTLFHERGRVSPFIQSHRIVTSWLDNVPGVYRHYRHLLPLFPSAVASWDLGGFDLVFSSSHAVAKGVRTGGTPHICYCHTPMRYLWDAEDDYRFGALRRGALNAVRPRLQRWDCEAAGRVDHFIANSRFVRQRIQQYYGRDAEVIHPPVDTHFFTPQASAGRSHSSEFYLAAGALVPYKRFDLIVEAFNKLGRPLVVAGAGPEMERLRRLAAGNVRLLGWVASEELRRLYRTARGLVFAARDDFGIVMVEAQACGCPVIAFGAGGAPEIIRDGMNGILFAEQHVDDLVRAVRRFESMTWPVGQVRHQVEKFSRANFQTRIRKFIEERAAGRSKARAAAGQPA